MPAKKKVEPEPESAVVEPEEVEAEDEAVEAVEQSEPVHLSHLKYGYSHPDVAVLQQVLNGHDLGYQLPVDGTYDSRTDAQVRECQRQHGLTVDPAYHSKVLTKQAKHLGLTVA